MDSLQAWVWGHERKAYTSQEFPSWPQDNSLAAEKVWAQAGSRCLHLTNSRYKFLVEEPGQRWDFSIPHQPVFVYNRQTCKQCFTKAEIHRSRWMCDVCNVALCLSDSRNCFRTFHLLPWDPQQLSSSATYA